jgi:hypothetical protein
LTPAAPDADPEVEAFLRAMKAESEAPPEPAKEVSVIKRAVASPPTRQEQNTGTGADRGAAVGGLLGAFLAIVVHNTLHTGFLLDLVIIFVGGVLGAAVGALIPTRPRRDHDRDVLRRRAGTRADAPPGPAGGPGVHDAVAEVTPAPVAQDAAGSDAQPAVRCPECHSPLTPEQAAGDVCPACHGPLPDESGRPGEDLPAIPSGTANTRQVWAGRYVALFLGGLVGGLVFLLLAQQYSHNYPEHARRARAEDRPPWDPKRLAEEEVERRVFSKRLARYEAVRNCKSGLGIIALGFFLAALGAAIGLFRFLPGSAARADPLAAGGFVMLWLCCAGSIVIGAVLFGIGLRDSWSPGH